MTATDATTIKEGGLDNADVRALLDVHWRQMRAESPPEACHVMAIGDLADPAIRFFAMRDAHGTLLGIGALKAIEPRHGEIKSMRTAPDALGRGIGRSLLRHLMDRARAAGMSRLSLETGNSPLFDAANRLYQSEGFMPCGPFGAYSATPFTLFYSREL